MAKVKEEQIFIGIDNEVIELTGKDKELFLADQAQMQKDLEEQEIRLQNELQLKKSAFAKLGLTAEEINAIL
jgi:hypothetical protein